MLARVDAQRAAAREGPLRARLASTAARSPGMLRQRHVPSRHPVRRPRERRLCGRPSALRQSHLGRLPFLRAARARDRVDVPLLPLGARRRVPRHAGPASPASAPRCARRGRARACRRPGHRIEYGPLGTQRCNQRNTRAHGCTREGSASTRSRCAPVKRTEQGRRAWRGGGPGSGQGGRRARCTAVANVGTRTPAQYGQRERREKKG
jgi:hypothetical protein